MRVRFALLVSWVASLVCVARSHADQWFVVDVNHGGHCTPSPFGDLASTYIHLAHENGWGPCEVTKSGVLYQIKCEHVPKDMYDVVFMSDDLPSCQTFMVKVAGSLEAERTATENDDKSPAQTPQPSIASETDAAGGRKHRTEVVVTWRGGALTRDDVAEEFQQLPAPSRTYLTAPDRKRQFVENLILNDLLYEEGQKAGYEKDPDIERQVKNMRKRLVVQKVMQQYGTASKAHCDELKKLADVHVDDAALARVAMPPAPASNGPGAP